MQGKLLLIGLFLSISAFAQRQPNKLYVEGTVMGYHYEPKKFFKKEQVEIQGSLEGVKLEARDSKNKKIGEGKTDSGGSFGLYLPLEGTTTLSFSKTGYGNSAITLDLTTAQKGPSYEAGLVLTNIEFILNDNENDFSIDNGIPFAKVKYVSTSRTFIVNPVVFDKKNRLFKEIENSTPVNLLERSIRKNRGLNDDLNISGGDNVENANNTNIEGNYSDGVSNNADQNNELLNKIKVIGPSKFGEITNWEDLTEEDIESRAQEIEAAWEQLEMDKKAAFTEEDFLLIEAREQLLISAEKELEAARTYIEEQQNKIQAQRNFIFALVGFVLLLGAFIFLLVRSNKEKKKANEELDKRNKKIMSSINYAERIQRSVLLRDEQIKAFLPESFVFYQPLDVVSGDFYWFSKIGDKVIMAAVDCTGHGVPGAFMSLIGNTLLNKIVNENKVTQPKDILKALHEGIVESLQQDHGKGSAQDGMDMSICMIDQKTSELTFAGAMNPVYYVKDGEVNELSADIRGIGGASRRKKPRPVVFKEQSINVSPGTCIYLFSDGYMDQFGGRNNEKFNISRFKDLLKEVNDMPMEEQKMAIGAALSKWKGAYKQIDDILVIGARV